ncbi:hypothetical protein ACFFKE_32765 [Streptomyces mutabilis]|uniref:hypothetical protein n=1 Tax=Streptomyces mutabilis TaxID=67332 RepID=UPI0017822980|nr:hypothetical protein [Streptomyces mutabilis]
MEDVLSRQFMQVTARVQDHRGDQAQALIDVPGRHTQPGTVIAHGVQVADLRMGSEKAWIIHEALRVREDTGAPSTYDAAPERRGSETAEFTAMVVEAGRALGASRG